MNHTNHNSKSNKVNIQGTPRTSIFSRFCRAVCPCVPHSPDIIQTPRVSFITPEKQLSTQLDAWGSTKSEENQSKIDSPKKNLIFKSTYEKSTSPNKLQEIVPQRSFSSEITLANYPITKFREMQLLVIGDCKTKILAKVISTRLMPSKESIQKTKLSFKVQKQVPLYGQTEVDNLWKSRYILFERFDKGIKIDKNSWFNTLPEVVAEYISTRTKCITILDGLSGIGSAAIKFANKCHTVIINDPNQQKLQCLQNNISIYGADNIVRNNKNFLALQSICPQPQVVYLQPPLKNSKDYQLLEINPQSYFVKPSLQELLQKAFSISNNVVLMLPSNVNIQALGIIYFNAVMRAKQNCSPSCSIQIQKIYFNRKLKYIAVYYGPMVNRQITIKDELNFIYKILNDGKSTTFKHKNAVKHIRSKYGMMNLLWFTSECLKYEGDTIMQKLFEMIRANDLLPKKLLENLMKPTISTITLNRLPTLQQEKCDQIENEAGQSETDSRTNSFITNYGDDERFQKSNQEYRGTIMVNGKATYRMTLEASSYNERAALQKTMLSLN